MSGELLVIRVDKREIVDVDDTFELRHLGEVQLRADVGVGEQQDAVRVIDKVVDIVRVEICEDRDDYGFVGVDCEERNGPTVGVSCAERNLVALLDSGLLEENVEFFKNFRDVRILERLSTILAESRLSPVTFDSRLENRKVMLHISGQLEFLMRK